MITVNNAKCEINGSEEEIGFELFTLIQTCAEHPALRNCYVDAINFYFAHNGENKK